MFLRRWRKPEDLEENTHTHSLLSSGSEELWDSSTTHCTTTPATKNTINPWDRYAFLHGYTLSMCENVCYLLQNFYEVVSCASKLNTPTSISIYFKGLAQDILMRWKSLGIWTRECISSLVSFAYCLETVVSQTTGISKPHIPPLTPEQEHWRHTCRPKLTLFNSTVVNVAGSTQSPWGAALWYIACVLWVISLSSFYLPK